MDWDYKKYLKEIILMAFLFGFMISFIQAFKNTEFGEEMTLDEFKNGVIGGINGIICFFYAILSCLLSLKVDYSNYLVKYDKTFKKYLIFVIFYVILIVITYLIIGLGINNIIASIVTFLFRSCIIFAIIFFILAIMNKRNKIKK